MEKCIVIELKLTGVTQYAKPPAKRRGMTIWVRYALAWRQRTPLTARRRHRPLFLAGASIYRRVLSRCEPTRCLAAVQKRNIVYIFSSSSYSYSACISPSLLFQVISVGLKCARLGDEESLSLSILLVSSFTHRPIQPWSAQWQLGEESALVIIRK